MGRTLDRIKQPIAQELDDFEKRFRDTLRSPVALMDRITYYIVRRKGKQVRPMFVFLSAKACGGFTDESYVAASLIEILHTASLVHDDVVDESYERRGFFSINALWKNKIAVLVGDYFLAKGLLIALKHKQYRILEITSTAVQALSEGELLQIEKARRLDIDEAIYFEVIRQKTASLIAAACEAGAASVTQDETTLRLMHDFGEKIGIAFQIRDDLFDFGTDNVGKPLGIDIKEKKMTLPLIHALNQAPAGERSHIIRLIKKYSDKPEKVAEVIRFVHASAGIAYAEAAMYRYRDEAFALLHQLPSSPARESLEALVNYVVERKY
ncbi:polyprenyl synthetase family protein [Neolewinella lacunae]|uniref:Polyprenyl synthetase family protein n=1 Tax=Neolewinella lacunae TaxID=1517758 RepID=A0A923PPV7_9BACT|nr:polyprenyl synthetase family protein [Neolewinella lacunae]MBC6996681.1 polyprenyl synthetase family protein [Neolewinella lacunae]MDN3633454.1 polyprenyl synthetase family protein [Neolewinella lacunae]